MFHYMVFKWAAPTSPVHNTGLSRIENYGPSLAHRFPSAQQQEKNDCFQLLCSSGGCNFPGNFILSVPHYVYWGKWPCTPLPLASFRMDMAPGPKWDQRYRFRPRVCGDLSQLWMCLVHSALLFANTESPSFQEPAPSPFILFLRGCSAHPTVLPMPMIYIKDPWYLIGFPGPWALHIHLHSCVPCLCHQMLTSSSLGLLFPRCIFHTQLVLNTFERSQNDTVPYPYNSFPSLLSLMAYHYILGLL